MKILKHVEVLLNSDSLFVSKDDLETMERFASLLNGENITLESRLKRLNNLLVDDKSANETPENNDLESGHDFHNAEEDDNSQSLRSLQNKKTLLLKSFDSSRNLSSKRNLTPSGNRSSFNEHWSRSLSGNRSNLSSAVSNQSSTVDRNAIQDFLNSSNTGLPSQSFHKVSARYTRFPYDQNA